MISVCVIASGSKGNCYYLTKGDSSLLLECGIEVKKISKGTGYKLSSVDGVLITHEHKDHSLVAEKLLSRGLNLYASNGTLEAINCLDGHTVVADKMFNVGEWGIYPFETLHDAEEPLGYRIKHCNDCLLFATDSYYIKKYFPIVTQFLIECNYCEEILERNYEEGVVDEKRYNRTFHSHFSLKNLKKYLSHYNFKNVKEIRLCHISEINSDVDKMVREIQQETGVPVYV